MKRVIVSGGGTGGHIYPAITIAREIQRLEETQVLFVGTPKGMESQIIPREGFDFAPLPAAGLKRKLTAENLKVLAETAGSLWKARKILHDFKPDVVIGTGGYVCGPILMAAALSRIPTMIQEQNVIPGITNKILSYVVDKIALGYEEAKPRFPHPEKCVYTGNPIRREILSAHRAQARARLGIPPDAFMVLTAGGSRGARTINNAMIGVHRFFAEDDGIYLYHVTGTAEYDRVVSALGDVTEDGHFGRGSRIVSYQNDMPSALAAADLVIYRAGAIGLAELAARGVPSILIPYPYAAEDHQTFNARVFVKNGASKMIVDKYLTADELIQDIRELKEDPELLESMSASSRKLGKIYAGADIARMALALAGQ